MNLSSPTCNVCPHSAHEAKCLLTALCYQPLSDLQRGSASCYLPMDLSCPWMSLPELQPLDWLPTSMFIIVIMDLPGSHWTISDPVHLHQT